jgi:hypothetical protein
MTGYSPNGFRDDAARTLKPSKPLFRLTFTEED